LVAVRLAVAPVAVMKIEYRDVDRFAGAVGFWPVADQRSTHYVHR